MLVQDIRFDTPRSQHAAAALALLLAALLVWRLPALLATWMLFVVLAPLVEEIVFRRGVQQGLQRLGAGGVPAIVMTAVLFSLAHGFTRSWVLAAGVFVPALVIGVLYERSGRLGACVWLHAGFNTAWLAAFGAGVAR